MKIIIATIALVFIVNMMAAQKIKEADVPKVILNSFQNNFKGIKVEKWEKEKDGNYKAEFDVNKIETSATFSADGKLLETEQEIKISTLPKTVTGYIDKKYPSHKIAEAAIIIDTSGKKMYEAEVKIGKEKKDLLFDENGNFIK